MTLQAETDTLTATGNICLEDTGSSAADTRGKALHSKRAQLICILGGSFWNPNRGIGVLTSGAVAAIRRAFAGREIILLDYGTEDRTYLTEDGTPIRLINLRFSKKLSLRNNVGRLLVKAFLLRFVPASMRARWIEKDQYLSLLANCEFFLSLAGGDSFADIYGLRRLVYVSLPQFLALALKRPLVLLPQTYGPFAGKMARFLARSIVQRASLVFSRDTEGVRTIKEQLGLSHKQVETSCDLGFALAPKEPENAAARALVSRKASETIVGLNISGLLLVGGYNRSNMFGLKGDYPALIKSLLTYFIKEKGCRVLLVPHVFGASMENDVAAVKSVYSEYKNVFGEHLLLCDYELDHQEVKWIIGQTDFFLGSRMHACIAAVSQCIPTANLAYSDKFRGVMNSAKVGELVIELYNVDNAQVLARVAEIFEAREVWRDHLRSVIPGVNASVLNILKEHPVTERAS